MTVSTTTATKTAAGDGIVTAFATNFEFLSETHLVVKVRVDSTGVETTQVLNVDYTVSGAGSESGGTVTMTTAPAEGETLVIERVTPRTQDSGLNPASGFSATAVGGPLDKMTMLVQEMSAKLDRAVLLPIGETSQVFPSALARASKYAFFDASGNMIATGNVVPGDVTVSSYMETVLDDGDAATARSTLGLDLYLTLLETLQSFSITTGTSTAYVATTAWSFAEEDLSTFWNLFRIKFHTTCGDDPTVTIDGNGPYSIRHARFQDGQLTAVKAGQIVANTVVFGYIDTSTEQFVILAGLNFYQQDQLNNIYKEVDESKTSDASNSADNELNVTTVYPGRWKVEAFIHWDAGAGGIKFRLPVPAGCTLAYTVNGDVDGKYKGSSDYSDATEDTDLMAHIVGVLENPTASAVGLLFSWSQASSNAAPTTVKEGSVLTLKHIKEKS